VLWRGGRQTRGAVGSHALTPALTLTLPLSPLPPRAAPPCADPTTTFPVDMSDKQCLGLTQIPYAGDANACQDACCADDTCAVWQWCTNSSCSPTSSCWIGPSDLSCQSAPGWQSRGRTPPKPPAPPAPGGCSDPHCQPGTDDTTWRVVDVPHDFVVEGNFTPSAIMSHGYLPLGSGWYRKHLTVPAAYKATPTVMYLDVDGAQSSSTVYLNGFYVGAHGSGYTAARYFLNSSWINFEGDNLLAVYVDGTKPDGWWYDGGGLYRHVWLTAVTTPGAYLAPWGVYAPSSVDGAITWAGGAPFGDGVLSPSVDVWNNATAASSFSLTLTVYDASGAAVGSASGSGSVAGGGGVTTWSPSSPIALPGAALWHLVDAPLKPALYTLAVALSVGGAPVDAQNVTFGIRRTRWSNATGFWLNDVNTKILGTANHQDFAGMGVAFPDALQRHRVAKLKQMGVNGWRT
jgi:beta-galactosidase